MHKHLRSSPRGLHASLSLALCVGSLLACGSQRALDLAVESTGGKEALLALSSQVTMVSGQRFEPGQARTPSDPPVALGDFTYTASHDIAGDRLAVEWKRPSIVGFPLSYSEVLNRDLGHFLGADSVGAPQQMQAPMFSARVAAVRKHQRLFQPHLLLRRALQKPEIVISQGDSIYQGVPHKLLTLKDAFQPINLYINAQTGTPSLLETVEDDPMRGDALLQVTYADYRVVGGIKVPHEVTLSLAGVQIHTEKRSSITVNAQVASTLFSLPSGVQPSFDAADAQRGEAISEYLHRFAAVGFPADFDGGRSVTTPQYGRGVFHIAGAAAHSLAIEMEQGIVVVEAPGDDSRSRGVIAAIRRVLPATKKITHIINTHHHDDHAGGLRTYVSEGATLVTANTNEAYLRRSITAPHVSRPDTLQQKPATLRVQAVGDTTLEIKDATRTVRVYKIANAHAEGMLVVYVADEKLLFVADLYSPGFFPPDMPIQGPFGTGAKDLYKAITALKLDDPALRIIGAHGFGTATLAALKVNAGM